VTNDGDEIALMNIERWVASVRPETPAPTIAILFMI